MYFIMIFNVMFTMFFLMILIMYIRFFIVIFTMVTMFFYYELYYVIQVSYTNSYRDVNRSCDCLTGDAYCLTCHDDFCTPDKEDDDGGKSNEDDWVMASTGSAAKTSVSVIAIALICLVIKA